MFKRKFREKAENLFDYLMYYVANHPEFEFGIDPQMRTATTRFLGKDYEFFVLDFVIVYRGLAFECGINLYNGHSELFVNKNKWFFKNIYQEDSTPDYIVERFFFWLDLASYGDLNIKYWPLICYESSPTRGEFAGVRVLYNNKYYDILAGDTERIRVDLSHLISGPGECIKVFKKDGKYLYLSQIESSRKVDKIEDTGLLKGIISSIIVESAHYSYIHSD